MNGNWITQGRVVNGQWLGPCLATEACHEGGTALPLHAHPRASFTLVIGGAIEERLDRDRHACGPGDVVYRPPLAPHANRYAAGGALSFVIALPAGQSGDLIGGPFRLPAHQRVLRDPRVTRLMVRLRAMAARDGVIGMRVEESLHELAALASVPPQGLPFRHSSTVGNRGSGPPPWLARVFDRVHAAYRRVPSLAEMATDAGVYPDSLSRAFRRCYGFTISDLVRRRRVEHAACEIRGGTRALGAIAYSAGFSDQSHMTRQMKLYLGVTPGELARDRSD